MFPIHCMRFIASCLFVVVAGAGCASTTQTWKHATATELSDPVLRGCLVDRSTAPARPAALVVQYFVAGNELPNFAKSPADYFIVIPLDEEGIPAWPLGFGGETRDLYQISVQMSPEQRQALADMRLSPADFARGRDAFHSADFLPVHRSFYSGGGAHLGARLASDVPLSVVFFLPDETGVTFSRPAISRRPSPAGSQVLLLPDHQPRPTDERNANIAAAIVVTPLTLGYDTIVGIPMTVAWQLWGH